MAPSHPNGNGDGAIRITNREVYDALQDVKTNVAEIRLDMKDIKNNEIRTVKDTLVEHQKRIRGLELRFYGVLAGLVGAIVILIQGGG